jgi:hypothetical protein
MRIRFVIRAMEFKLNYKIQCIPFINSSSLKTFVLLYKDRSAHSLKKSLNTFCRGSVSMISPQSQALCLGGKPLNFVLHESKVILQYWSVCNEVIWAPSHSIKTSCSVQLVTDTHFPLPTDYGNLEKVHSDHKY